MSFILNGFSSSTFLSNLDGNISSSITLFSSIFSSFGKSIFLNSSFNFSNSDKSLPISSTSLLGINKGLSSSSNNETIFSSTFGFSSLIIGSNVVTSTFCGSSIFTSSLTSSLTSGILLVSSKIDFTGFSSSTFGSSLTTSLGNSSLTSETSTFVGSVFSSLKVSSSNFCNLFVSSNF